MAFNRMSIATISSPEFINIEGISPFASKCEVKVLYLGGNRNGSFINKEVATNMAQTLPGCPIVGYYSEDKEDFRDHGDQMIINGDGIQFKCLTVPYGFIAPNARVWFQEFEDTDEFGNKEIRTYLMAEGYLWTEQFEEAKKVINEGRPQSMELDSKTLKGYWSTDNNRGIDFFIINDAIFSKLCILGEDVEPCFEGADINAPKISSTFSKNEKAFTHTLFTMMNELKELTLNNEGGKTMDPSREYVVLDNSDVTATTATSTSAIVTIGVDGTIIEKNSETEDKTVLENNTEIENNIEEFTKNNSDGEKKKEEDEEGSEKKENTEKKDGGEAKEKDDEEKEDDKKKPTKNSLEEKFALLEQELENTKAELKILKEENVALNNFKAQVEDKEKDELINSFYMLSDEDKKSVIENKSKFTLDEIEKELSVICVRKKVNFNLDEEEKTTEKVVPTTFNVNSVEDNDLPAWLKAVENRRNAE
jgi:hypothetical protein